MDAVAPNLPKKGQTFLSGPGRGTLPTSANYGNEAQMEGRQKNFPNLVPSTNAAAQNIRDGQEKTCVLVRNASTIPLKRRRIVKWQAGFRGRRVDGYCNVDAEEVAGVVDEALGANQTVLPNDLFWLEVKGPCLVNLPWGSGAPNVVTANGILYALTAAASTGDTAGHAQMFAATTGTTAALSQILNLIGYAMSAATTGNTGGGTTNNEVLVDLKILK